MAGKPETSEKMERTNRIARGLAIDFELFKDEHASRNLARTVKGHKGILGAAVSCSDYGGTDFDPHTTCGDELHTLLDRVFQLAIEFELDLDFHVDENGNEESKGFVYISNATIRKQITKDKSFVGIVAPP